MSFKPGVLKAVFDLKRTKVRGDNLMSSCPLGTHEDKHPSFGIDLNTGQWNCYSCQEKGSNIRTLAYKMKILLPDDLMMESLILAPKVPEPDYAIPCAGLEGLSENTDKAYELLQEKGISYSALKRFKVGYKNGSITFPCVMPDSQMYGWIERNNLWDGRYGFKPNGVKRKHLLFGLDRQIKRAYLVESMTDMLKLVSWHIEAVSTCGNMIFEEQAKNIISNCGEIVLVPQNDTPAKKWIADAEKVFKGKIKVYGIHINREFKDVGDSGYTRESWASDSKKVKFLY